MSRNGLVRALSSTVLMAVAIHLPSAEASYVPSNEEVLSLTDGSDMSRADANDRIGRRPTAGMTPSNVGQGPSLTQPQFSGGGPDVIPAKKNYLKRLTAPNTTPPVPTCFQVGGCVITTGPLITCVSVTVRWPDGSTSQCYVPIQDPYSKTGSSPFGFGVQGCNKGKFTNPGSSGGGDITIQPVQNPGGGKPRIPQGCKTVFPVTFQ